MNRQKFGNNLLPVFRSRPGENSLNQQRNYWVSICRDSGRVSILNLPPNRKLEINPYGDYVISIVSMKEALKLKKHLEKSPSLLEKYINRY